jgi:hypothetical protein
MKTVIESDLPDFKKFVLSDQQIKEEQDRLKGGKKPGPEKKTGFRFIRIPLKACRKLAEEDSVFAMFCALYEAWFTTGRKDEHPNPFPLSHSDTGKWGLTRMQKSRALKSLIRTGLITVSQRNPKKLLIRLTWEPRFIRRRVTPALQGVTPALHPTSEKRLLSSSLNTSLKKYVPN